MYVNRARKNPYARRTVFDILSAAVGLAVIAVGVISFIEPEENSWLFPIVFLLASVFQCLVAVPRMMGGYGRKSGR